MSPETRSLDALFEPGSIAVIGASHTGGKVGYTLLYNILNSDYDGDVYPINPKGGEIMGEEVYTSIEDVPDDLDLGVIVIPAEGVKDALHQCGEKGFKHIIIITSGFSEVGNVQMERELVEEAEKYGMRILGPNVFGIYSARSDLNAR